MMPRHSRPWRNAMPQKYPHRNQLKYTRKRYRVRNWNEYEAGLRRRGDLTIWFSDEALRDWQPPVGGKPGGQRRYSDIAIEAALTVRAVYGLALRQTEGFLRSVARLLHLDIEIPDHSTLSRRSSSLRAHVRKTSDTAGADSDQRDKNVEHIASHGRRHWQKASGYTRRSLVETAVWRFKNEFGGALSSRSMPAQVAEVHIACSILNTMTKLAMPDGHCVS
jgi:hypothetical protein